MTLDERLVADPVVRFDRVSVRYPGQDHPAVADVSLDVFDGEMLLVVGPTGSGKSTLLGAINGLVPHFTGGTMYGEVTVAGRNTAQHPPRELADVVGVVPQNPLNSFVTDSVEEELAYAMESLGLPGDVMRRRVEETLDLLGLTELRSRPLLSLSGGQRQRVAIGAVLTVHPRVLVLDEPTSALDPGAAEEVLGTLQRLVHDLGLTVVIAEHRLERVIQYADRVALLPGADRDFLVDQPAAVMAVSPVVPPVVQLGRWASWHPLPLSVREARRYAPSLRRELAHRVGTRPVAAPGAVVASTRTATVRYHETVALQDVSLDLHRGEAVAVMGRNGAGKSTLLGLLTGTVAVARGRVTVLSEDPATLSGPALISRIGLVPQEPTDLLICETVAQECDLADRTAGLARGTAERLLHRLAPGIKPASHPRDLSEGQRLILALAVVLAAEPPILLLDEPTRGLDYDTKRVLIEILQELRETGTAVVLATHDVELAAEVADRVVVLADGDVVADGPAPEVVVGSPMFAPQVAKILGEGPWLTVSQVTAAMAS